LVQRIRHSFQKIDPRLAFPPVSPLFSTNPKSPREGQARAFRKAYLEPEEKGETKMKRQLANLILAVSSVCIYGSVVAGSALHAQSYEMVAKVPFAFHLDKTDFPAGTYIVERSGTAAFQVIENRNGHKAAIPGGTYLENKGTPRLVFRCYGNERFLAEVWNTTGTGSRVPVTKRERDVIERSGPEVATLTIPAAIGQ
jgi:hypothetical protein